MHKTAGSSGSPPPPPPSLTASEVARGNKRRNSQGFESSTQTFQLSIPGGVVSPVAFSSHVQFTEPENECDVTLYGSR